MQQDQVVESDRLRCAAKQRQTNASSASCCVEEVVEIGEHGEFIVRQVTHADVVDE
jgi:hypothetical protein